MPTQTRKTKPTRTRVRRERRGDAWLGGPEGVQIRMTRWMPQSPTAKQHALLWLTDREVFYGGAAGGAKSSGLLLAALQYVDIPGYAAILFRRTTTDLALPGALMARSKEWLADTDAHWSEQRKTWTFPSGATLSFGYLQHADDKFRYQSAEFQFIGFDELTQFPESDYLYLFSRLRRPSTIDPNNALAKVPLRMRSASNPGGRGHRWVKSRFIDRSTRGDRIFLPAALKDNPYVDQSTYELSLAQVDEQTRLQLLNGDWTARGPGHWMIDHEHLDAAIELGEAYDSWLADGRLPAPDGGVINGGIDWGERTQAYAIWQLERGGIYVPPSEVVMAHREPGASTNAMLDAWLKFGYPLGEARYDSAGVQSNRTFKKTARARPGLRRLATVSIPFNKFKRDTIGYLRFLAERTANDHTTQVLAISPRNTTLCDQLYEWERKDEDTDEAVKENDHGPDAIVAGTAPVATRHWNRVKELQNEAKTRLAKNLDELAA